MNYPIGFLYDEDYHTHQDEDYYMYIYIFEVSGDLPGSCVNHPCFLQATRNTGTTLIKLVAYNAFDASLLLVNMGVTPVRVLKLRQHD